MSGGVSAEEMHEKHADLLEALENAFQALTSVTVKTREEGEILLNAARKAKAAIEKVKGGAK